MTLDLAIVLALLAAAVVMFARDKPRMDVVAVLMLTALPLSGILTVNEALAGFADPSVILIAALFVIGEGLVRTGVARRLGDLLVTRAGDNEARLVALLMIAVAGIGSVMSSTGVVAIFIPVVLRIAANIGAPPGRLMMPLSVAALISGMMTLVATPPNLVVQAEVVRAGYQGFSFFSFAPFGIPILAVAVLYMATARRWLGGKAAPRPPARERPRLSTWAQEYALGGREYRLRTPPGSPLVGKQLGRLHLRANEGVNVIAIDRNARFGRSLVQPHPGTVLEAGDVLFLDVFSSKTRIDDVCRRYQLEMLPLPARYFADLTQEIGMAEVMVPASSSLVDRSVVQATFRSRYDLSVVGLKRGSTARREDILEEPLKIGDRLLVAGPWRAIRKLQSDMTDLVVYALPAEFDDIAPAASRARHALAILGLVVVLMATGIVPNVVAALIGCLLMGLTGCIDMNGAYRAIHWQTLVLIAGMLPFSAALQKTGGVDLAAGMLIELIGGAGPRTILAALFTLTAVMGLFISNTATAVLMAPVALAVAKELGASPYPFAMTVALGASAAFITPVSSPVNTLVVGPGGYDFMDFVRIGTPLALMALAITVLMVPWLLPF
ncbi:SLC13 family permease [Pseudoxanthobacter sp.]|uniref:SLC13 family permease n=1 Tax=Pseudoxanthobacter sp. TaxID=1925742 RepID=UPI002FE360F1